MDIKNTKIAVVGLGYVGLPLAIEFGKQFETVGFDINHLRVNELSNGIDTTLECSKSELTESANLHFTTDVNMIKDCNVYIVTVPTPIDQFKQPDLGPLINASKALGKVISSGDVIIYESTVYPGVTEDVCVPELEANSGLKFNYDFYVGYSPERINPGDKEHRVTNILKVTSGSNEATADFVDELYNKIIIAGTHKASSIKVAEASKVIENVQRDVNIALINELHQIFNLLDIDTKAVIEAASTKWNFMKLLPGLVGGHCISVDPYYLLHKSSSMGYVPDLIRTARNINDGMAEYIKRDFINKLLYNKINPVNCRVLILGFSFKENCPDIRNTKVFPLYLELVQSGFDVSVYDPVVDPVEVEKAFGIKIITNCEKLSQYDVGILTVGHEEIISIVKAGILTFEKDYIMDFKGLLNNI